MVNAYAPNNLIRLTVAFTLVGAAADPTAVSLTVKDPLAVKTTYTYAGAQVIKDSVGNYHYDLTVVTAGPWEYAWQGTGAVVVQAEGDFRVLPSEVA